MKKTRAPPGCQSEGSRKKVYLMVALSLSPNDLVVKGYGNAVQVSKPIGKAPKISDEVQKGLKKAISMYTFKTIRNLRLWFSQYGNLVTHEILLTYGSKNFPTNIRIAQGHLRRFLKWLQRNKVKDHIWFKEYQERGAVHFHILVDHYVKYQEINRIWNKIVQGDGYDEVTGTGINLIKHKDRMGWYCSKYFGKRDQKTIPDNVILNGRWWGSNLPLRPEIVVIRCLDKNQRNKLFRVVNHWYNHKLKQWGKKKGIKYRRPVKQGGFTVFDEAKAVGNVLGRYSKEIKLIEIKYLNEEGQCYSQG